MTVKSKTPAPLKSIARRHFLAAIPAALGASLAASAAQEQAPRVGKATLDSAATSTPSSGGALSTNAALSATAGWSGEMVTPRVALEVGEKNTVELMITGQLYDESTLLGAALALERATTWHTKNPSL